MFFSSSMTSTRSRESGVGFGKTTMSALFGHYAIRELSMQAAARLDRRWRREAGNGSALGCYLDAEHAAEIFTASDPTACGFVAAFFGVALMGIFPLPQLIKNILDFPEMGREREFLKKA